MSTPADETEVKQNALNTDEVYRQLSEEHNLYDIRLNQLLNIHFPSAQEQLEEVDLKKKKLALKDRMEAIRANNLASPVPA